MKKRIVAAVCAVLALGLVLTSCGKREGNSGKNGSVLAIEEQGFETPEEAIEAFVAGVASNDLAAALSACSIKSRADSYDLLAMTKRVRAYMTSMMMSAPSEYDFYRDINELRALNSLVQQIQHFSMSFFLDEDEVDSWIGIPVRLDEDGTEMQDFIAAIDPSALTQLKVEDYLSPVTNDQVEKSWREQAKVYGADEITERVVLYSLNRRYYVGGFQLMRFGDEWKISALNSVLMGQSAYGTVERIAIDEWEDGLGSTYFE